MKNRFTPWPVLHQAAVLAALAVLAVVIGAVLVNQQLRDSERKRAVNECRQLAFGDSRQAVDSFWRVREEFIFSLTNLPYERLLDAKEPAPGTLVTVRRFLALNQNIIRKLVVTRPDGYSRSASISGENYFALSPLAETGLPDPSADTVNLSGVVQAADGSIRAHVTAVIDPMRFWQDNLASFSLSHPNLWIHLIDARGRPVITRHGAAILTSTPVLSTGAQQQLQADARDSYEGRLVHSLSHDGRSLDLISAYVPVRIEAWRGLLMVSADEELVFGAGANALRLVAIMSGVLLALVTAIFLLIARHTLRHQRQIEESRLRIETVLNTVQSGILLIHSRTGRVTEVNAAALSLLGTEAEDILGQRIDTLLPVATETARTGRFEACIHPRTGSDRHVLANTAPLNLADSLYLLCSFVDITPLKETELRLQEAVTRAEHSAREAETANRAKSAFLAMMSHELRTPLNSILGLSESLIEKIHGPLTEKQERYLGLVLSSGQSLLDLINDILDLARIESGAEPLQLKPVSLLTLCEAALQVVRPASVKRRQTIETVLPDPGLVIRADPRRFKQILVNLLSNAVKFTPAEGTLGLRAVATEKEIRVCVWDRGIGIAEENRERIFKPFVQLDARLSREYAGTGLGLALVRQLTVLHGGRIEVSSVLGEGSAFTVVVPF